MYLSWHFIEEILILHFLGATISGSEDKKDEDLQDWHYAS